MDNQPINPSEVVPNEIVPPPKKSIGPIIGLVIVLALIILGGIYFWKDQMYENESYGENVGTTYETQDADTAALQQQSSSDELSSIEADINATNFDNIDKEFSEINAELSAQ